MNRYEIAALRQIWRTPVLRLCPSSKLEPQAFSYGALGSTQRNALVRMSLVLATQRRRRCGSRLWRSLPRYSSNCETRHVVTPITISKPFSDP